MLPNRKDSFRLFQFNGIQVYLHWSWFVVAIYEIQGRTARYSSPFWNVLEYLTLFLVVLLHEFGHSLACRQVGGKADQIVLWPLGGVAYVSPPQRPGATLWSIAAGPLVNVVLLVGLMIFGFICRQMGWLEGNPNAIAYLRDIMVMNLMLLVFNLLPIYPLDGGQILRALLWYPFGRARSLLVASILGMIGVLGLFALAVAQHSFWIGIMSVFVLLNCWRGLKEAQALARIAALPRHEGFRCPSCQTAPPVGNLWLCGKCHQPFDTFATQSRCPHCETLFEVTSCPECGERNPVSAWLLPPSLLIKQ